MRKRFQPKGQYRNLKLLAVSQRITKTSVKISSFHSSSMLMWILFLDDGRLPF